MSKRLCLLLILISNVLFVQAQKRIWSTFFFSEEYHEDQLLHVGISFPFTVSQYIYTPISQTAGEEMQLQNPKGFGFGMGIPIHLRLNPHVALETMPSIFAFQSQHLRVQDEKIYNLKTKNAESIELPLTAKIYSDKKHFAHKQHYYKVYMLGGAKWTNLLNYSHRIASQTETAHPVLYLQKNYFSAEVGLGIDFFFTYFKLSPELKFAQTLHDIGASSYRQTPINQKLDRIGLRGLQFSLIFH
jgi:hypothetical protein